MEKIVGDKGKTGQDAPSAFCSRLLHHTTIGTLQSVDFFHSVYKMTTFWQHVLKPKQYQEFGVLLLLLPLY